MRSGVCKPGGAGRALDARSMVTKENKDLRPVWMGC